MSSRQWLGTSGGFSLSVSFCRYLARCSSSAMHDFLDQMNTNILVNAGYTRILHVSIHMMINYIALQCDDYSVFVHAAQCAAVWAYEHFDMVMLSSLGKGTLNSSEWMNKIQLPNGSPRWANSHIFDTIINSISRFLYHCSAYSAFTKDRLMRKFKGGSTSNYHTIQ